MPKKFKICTNTRPTHINFYTPATGVTQRKTVKQALKDFKMDDWGHSYLLPISSNIFLNKSNMALLERYSENSQSTESKIAITPMPNNCQGYDAIAIEPISKGSLLLYAGEFLPENTDDSYCVNYQQSKVGDDWFAIAAKNCGNISRFISHAYNQETLKNDFQCASVEIADRIATANFERFVVTVGSYVLLALVASRDIAPKEKLYWSYASNSPGSTPMHLFFRDTYEIVPSHVYKRKKLPVYFQMDSKLFSSGLYYVDDILISNQNQLPEIPASESDMPYDLHIIPEFVETYVRSNERSFNALVSNQPLTIPIPNTEHPCIKKLKPGQSISNYLLKTVNSLFKPTDEFDFMASYYGKNKKGEHAGCYCRFKTFGKGELYYMSMVCDEKRMRHFVDEEGDGSIYILRDDLFKQGHDQTPKIPHSPLKKLSMFNLSAKEQEQINNLFSKEQLEELDKLAESIVREFRNF